ncbi:MAG TPA: chemotaxis response regulator protein-glutamate methylesterase [Spirochaetia bacterium]|nr:chemotaxis response regulator protein-glutamate methylesterase [Spirochaetia bacterium]
MNAEPYSVLVVDDSAMMRSLVGRIVESDPQTRLAGKAMNGRFALQKLDTLKPEVIILDLEMPEMNGIEFLHERRKRGIDIPVVVLSSLATKGAKVTMEALALGASDFVLKPSGSVSTDIHIVADQLLELVKSLGAEYRIRHGEPAARADTATTTVPQARPAVRPAPRPEPVVPPIIQRPPIEPGPIDLVALGISTGGPNALRKVFALIPADLPAPIVVVQHMPAGFTTEFAKSLDRVCAMTVTEAQDGDRLEDGHAYIAPGDHHVTVTWSAGSGRLHVNQDAPRNGHRPSADVLFASVAEHYGNRALGVIMTGMGKDGAAELGSILKKGGITVGQDAGSSVVYGMPKVAWEMGHVQYQASLPEMAEMITKLVSEHQ